MSVILSTSLYLSCEVTLCQKTHQVDRPQLSSVMLAPQLRTQSTYRRVSQPPLYISTVGPMAAAVTPESMNPIEVNSYCELETV